MVTGCSTSDRRHHSLHYGRQGHFSRWDRTQKSISLMSRTSEEYLWRLPIPLKVVLAVLIQASISIMSLSPGEEILLAQEIHLFLRRSVHSVPRIMNAHTSDRSSEPGDNDVTHSLSGSSPPPPLLFGTAAPVLIVHISLLVMKPN